MMFLMRPVERPYPVNDELSVGLDTGDADKADLAFTQERGASICPGEWWARGLSSARLGYDPFKPNPRGVYVGRVSITLSRTPTGFASS